MRTTSSYTTSDIAQGSFLFVSGVPLVGVERIDDQRRAFCFEHVEGLEELLMAFASGRPVPIAPARLIGSYKHLKSLLKMP